jgi:hypothetical protein
LIRRPLLQRGDQWDHLLRPLLYGLTILALSNCTTESCDCLPVIPAIVMGHVVRDGGTPVEGAQVSAFSGAAPGCESLDTDFGIEFTGADGAFGWAWRRPTCESAFVCWYSLAPWEKWLQWCPTRYCW